MKNVLFFSRSGYFSLFCNLNDNRYNSFHAVINLVEKDDVLKNGGTVVACFQEQFDELKLSDYPSNYLNSGFYPDRFMGGVAFEDRKLVLGKLISFWKNAIEKHNIDACVHETVSYEPEEVLSLVCKELNCIDLNFATTPVNGYFLWKPDPLSSSIPNAILDRINPNEMDRKLARKYINGIITNSESPFYLELINDKHYQRRKVADSLKDMVKTGLNYFKKRDLFNEISFKQKVFFFNNYDPKKYSAIDRLITDYYIRTSRYDEVSEIDLGTALLFPLHFEPEATLYYFSPDFSEQLNVIQQILKYMPLDCHLVVKEHPCQQGKLLTREYQKLQQRNSNLFYLKGSEDNRKLIKRAKAIITIAGTAGFEALVMGKPVFVMGNVYYDKHPSVMKIKAFFEIRDWFQKGLKKSSSQELTSEYLAKLLHIAHPGYYAGHQAASEKNYQNFRDAVVKGIEDAKP